MPHNPTRMKPIPGQASEGRANPKGIPYLYLATHRDTALAEVRPWIRSLFSVAQFKIVRDLVVVNKELCLRHNGGLTGFWEWIRLFAGYSLTEGEDFQSLWAGTCRSFALFQLFFRSGRRRFPKSYMRP